MFWQVSAVVAWQVEASSGRFWLGRLWRVSACSVLAVAFGQVWASFGVASFGSCVWASSGKLRQVLAVRASLGSARFGEFWYGSFWRVRARFGKASCGSCGMAS